MRKILILTCVSIAAVGIYLGWVFYSRWRSNQELLQQLKEPAAARDRAIVDAYGDSIKIMSFYAMPAAIRRGSTAQLCYSVVNAESVQIEPKPAEDVWPSRSRCVTVTPESDTAYRLFAKDAQGNTKTADLTITVQ